MISPARQIEVGAVAVAERLATSARLVFSPKKHEAMLLPGLEVVEVDGRLDVLELGDGHLDVGAEPDLSLRRRHCRAHDDRRDRCAASMIRSNGT